MEQLRSHTVTTNTRYKQEYQMVEELDFWFSAAEMLHVRLNTDGVCQRVP